MAFRIYQSRPGKAKGCQRSHGISRPTGAHHSPLIPNPTAIAATQTAHSSACYRCDSGTSPFRSSERALPCHFPVCSRAQRGVARRSEEHTSELQSRENLVCRLLLEKKKE